MLKITGILVPEAKPRAVNLWFEAFFIYCRVVYTIFLRSQAQKRQFRLEQRTQNCRFASVAKINNLHHNSVNFNCAFCSWSVHHLQWISFNNIPFIMWYFMSMNNHEFFLDFYGHANPSSKKKMFSNRKIKVSTKNYLLFLS